MKLQVVKGTTSKILTVFIQDSSSTTGAGLGSLDQTSSIVGGYVREGAVGLALAVDENVTTEGTYEAPTTDNQIRIGTPANMRTGVYELHIHNDLLASGADSVVISLGGASNMADLIIEIQLTTLDLNVAMTDASIADAVWDEILTGSSHNTATSAGRRLRQIEEAFVHASGVIATVTDGHTFTLDAGAVAIADYYIGDRLQIAEGTGAGQSRIIVAYTGGRVVTLDSDYITNPDTSSLYEIDAADVHVSVSDADLAEGFLTTYTNPTTITLDSGALGNADYYVDTMIIFTHGTGAGQARLITAYTAGRVATLFPALDTALDTTTTYHIQAVPITPQLVNAECDTAISDASLATAANLATVDTVVDSILVDTNELQTDWTNDGRLDLIIDAILSDTGELQTDWTNGGRLDLILDIIAADTTTDIPALIATAQADLDIITGASGVILDAAGLATDAVNKIRDAILAAVLTEPAQTAPPTTGIATLEDAIRYLYFALTNRVDSDAVAAFLEFFDRAGTTVQWKKAITDAASIGSEASGVTGP